MLSAGGAAGMLMLTAGVLVKLAAGEDGAPVQSISGVLMKSTAGAGAGGGSEAAEAAWGKSRSSVNIS